jgi:ParB family chromosome partitioning protein
MKKKGLFETSRVVYVSVSEIFADPNFARREPDLNSMKELSASIRKYGILQPLAVRRRDGGGFELISGDRRLRAAKLLEMQKVPCIILDVGEEASAALVIVENIQRRDMDFIEEARALERLRALYGYSQEELARMIGRSQSAVANKLRLLRLPPELLRAMRDAGLTERHARALLRLPNERVMAAAVADMIAQDMNVARAEEHIDALLSPDADEPKTPPEPAREPVILLRDHRFFVNSIERGAETMRKSGFDVEVSSREEAGSVTVTARISRAPRRASAY